MACKLVAIYQKYINEDNLRNLNVQKIDEAIANPNKYYAEFDIEKLEAELKDEDEK
jgi:hypothetical protein